MFKEFKEFALKGNMLDMATGIVIGAAVGTVVNSLVNDVLMPPVGLLLGGVDFSNWFLVIKEGATAAPYSIVEAAAEAGAVTVNWGLFINNLISFLVVSFVIYLLIRAMNQLRRAEEAAPTRHLEVKYYWERSEIF
ncbi:MAG: large conductance mechanosensitive channel protein MscL [Gammaproteobacteria bacterium]